MMQTVAVLVALLGLLFWRYDVVNEQRIVAEIAAKTAELETQYVRDTAEFSQNLNQQLAEKEAEFERQLDETQSELDAMRDTASRMAQKDPNGFGGDIHVRLARRMCRIQAASDREDRETCDNAASEAFISGQHFAVTVTQDTAEQYEENCEDGLDDYCEWSRTGLTSNGWITLLGWLDRVDGYALAQGNQIDSFHTLIEKLTEKDPQE